MTTASTTPTLALEGSAAPSAATPAVTRASTPKKNKAAAAPAKKTVVKAKPVKKTPAKPLKAAKPVKAAAKPKPAEKSAKPAPLKKPAAAKAEKHDKQDKPRKPKLVRDSFTIPKAEYLVLEALKQRAMQLAHPAKKSELLRAGIKALAAMADADLRNALQAVPAIKTGRPAAEKAD
ncbi:hypothetical protein RD110_13440 [Rhodoferax koreense]|uniref:Uncharacterized protein n=1 Tax=Rhodoferax koreensis TaxID=1842727 RepID=A0A1P8JWF3_9BURK|nr:hypothetical protein [Rhodoferax koreense]APW38073.1 hypothetical protein RD110_13440 [Rhodoferax koreense]